jgi:hypothetical protein
MRGTPSRPDRKDWSARAAFPNGELDLVPNLLLQLLYPMVVIIGDCRSERHRPGYPDLSQGDNERLLFIRGNNMAYDATFVAGIRQVRDDVLGLICDANMLRSEIIDQQWHQFDFEWRSCL